MIKDFAMPTPFSGLSWWHDLALCVVVCVCFFSYLLFYHHYLLCDLLLGLAVYGKPAAVRSRECEAEAALERQLVLAKSPQFSALSLE